MGRNEIGRLAEESACSERACLNVAAISPATRALGPGIRAAVWVQGCTIGCPGCLALDWTLMKPAHLLDPEQLAVDLMRNPEVSGLTLSGGEPMLQATALARLVYRARQIRDINVICFSGYRLNTLLNSPPVPGIDLLLGEIDVLIDGPYLQQRDDNRGLRGSANQQIHFFTDRIRNYDFHLGQRKVEIEVFDGQAFMIGIPTRTLHAAFAQAVEQARQQPVRMVGYERA